MVRVLWVMCGFVGRVLLLLRICVGVLMVIYCVMLYGLLLCCCCCDCMLALHVFVWSVFCFLCAVLWLVFALCFVVVECVLLCLICLCVSFVAYCETLYMLFASAFRVWFVLCFCV